MPKESIRTADRDTSLRIGWSKEGGNNVQLGVGVPGIVIGEVAYDDVWTPLDREGINALIRTLRRARDATFGVDA